MENRLWGTISIRIFLAVFLTTLLITFGSSFYQITRINMSFDMFLSRQEQELADMGWMRNMMEVERLGRLELLNEQFRSAIIQNMLLSVLAGAVAAIGTAWILAKNITGPLSKMEKGIGNVVDNKFKGRLELEGPYEVKELIKRFNHLLEELDRIEKLRTDLVSDITHELRTPLTKIQGQLEGIEDGVYSPSKKVIKAILDNTMQLEGIITRLQELIEISSGKVKLRKTNIDIEEMLGSVLGGYKKEGVEVVMNIDKGLKIKADNVKFRELIDNLVSNAFKYTEKGIISIDADSKRIRISDTGIGIPKGDLPNIFERFYRVDRSRSVETGGSGLGLAIAKEIAEAHGFSLRAESEYKKGSVFTIALSS